MFQPASLKGDSPTPIDEQIRKKYLFLYIIIIILSFIPCSLFEYTYYVFLWNETNIGLFFLLLPFNALLLLYILQCSALLISILFLAIIKVLHAPKEGVFTRDIHDKDYFYWNLRNLIKKWPLYLTASNPFPWFKNRFTLRWFGVKIGKKCMCDNAWISSEFVSIGKNCIITAMVIIGGSVVIGDNCWVGANSTIKDNLKIADRTYIGTGTNVVKDIVEPGFVWTGNPARAMRPSDEL